MSYKVKKGDTLSKIAKEHGLSLSELLKLNKIPHDKADYIRIGQEIKVSSNPIENRKTALIARMTAKSSAKKEDIQTPKQESVLVRKPINPNIQVVDTAYLKANAKQIQQQLLAEKFDIGKTGVDGIWGKASQSALDKAKAAGYKLVNGKLVKPASSAKPELTSKSSIRRVFESMGDRALGSMGAYSAVIKANAKEPVKKTKEQDLQEQLLKVGYNVGNTGADGKWGKNSQAALDKALSEGYTLKDGKLVAPGLVKHLQGQSQKTNSETESPREKPSFGTQLNRFINAVNSPRRYVANKITQAGANSNNEVIRGVAFAGNILLGGLSDALRARVNSKINEIYPGWIDEKNKDQIGKGYPVWSIDKEFGLARYYDAEGNLLISSPAGTGLVRGNKSREGDNKTPEGVYILSSPELGKNKKGGEASFGPYFYRTNHKNEDSGNLSGVGLHGTGFPILNGSNVSHGCVRIDNKDIETFYNTAPNKGANTKIIINR